MSGSVISKPTLALLGEKGTEVVTPLDKMGHQMMTIIYEVDGRQMTRTIMPYAVGEKVVPALWVASAEIVGYDFVRYNISPLMMPNVFGAPDRVASSIP